MPLSHRLLAASVVALLAAQPLVAGAQATVKPDGRFRYAFGAGASVASGNTSAASVNLKGEGVRATDDSKWVFGATGAWAREDGATTAEKITAGTQYDRDFTPIYFSFGSLDYLRDRFANLSGRYGAHAGVGRHVIRSEATTFDVSVGAGYVEDRYVSPATVDGALRTRYGRPEALLAEESSHKWTSTTTFRQKLTVFPALRSGGGVRSVFDAALSVAMTPLLSLDVGLNVRYDSEPGVGYKTTDTLFTTSLSVRLD